MQEYIDRFLRFLEKGKNYSENTIAAYRNDLGQFLTFINQETEGAVVSWDQVDQSLMLAYGRHLDERDYASSTIARKIASVKSFFYFLVDVGLLKENPAPVLDAPKVEKRTPRILSHKEIERLLAEPAKSSTPKALRDQALLDLFYATGMRVSEVIDLTVEDLDLAKTHVTCASRDQEARQLPLTERAMESLRAYVEKGREALLGEQQEDALFLNQRGHPLTRQGLWLIIKSYAEAANLGRDVTPHTLRHSFAAHRLAQGSKLQRVRKLLGHANISTTQVYRDIVNNLKETPEIESP